MLKVCQFADHDPEQRRIVDGGEPNVKHGQSKAQTEADEKSEKAVEDFFPGTGFAKSWKRSVHALIVCGLTACDRNSRFRYRHFLFITKSTKAQGGNTYK
jgi:hypothetical protein